MLGTAKRLFFFSLRVIPFEAMRLMRPPSREGLETDVTVEMDEHNPNETILSVDGPTSVVCENHPRPVNLSFSTAASRTSSFKPYSETSGKRSEM